MKRKATEIEDTSGSNPKKKCWKEPKVSCDKCGKVLNKRSLPHHLTLPHAENKAASNDASTPKKICDQCGKFFHANDLEHHLKTVHERKIRVRKISSKFACPTCQERYASALQLEQHQCLMHGKEMPFACKDCPKRFLDNRQLKSHLLVHVTERAYSCSECDKKFKSESAVKLHTKSAHGEKKSYPCSNCSKICASPKNLQDHHQKYHAEAPAHKCAQCDRTFYSARDLKEHERRHAGIRPYKCDECTSDFVTERALSTHKKRHSGIKPHLCTICDVGFFTKQELRGHDKCWHSPEGMQRKKKQEVRLTALLKEKYVIDTEVYVRYKGGCVPQPDKFYARIDIHIVTIITCFLILECDEWGHKSYLTSCEVSRMEQIHEAVLKEGISVPIVFLRYNPNGIVHKEGKKQKMPRVIREEHLLQLLQEIQSGKVTFEKTLNVIYLFYDMMNGEPQVCADDDYAPQMKSCVDMTLSRRW